MGGYQNYGPFLGTPNIRCRIIIGSPKGTIILTTAYMGLMCEAGSPTRITPISWTRPMSPKVATLSK